MKSKDEINYWFERCEKAEKELEKKKKWIKKQNKDMHRMCEEEKTYLQTIAKLDGELEHYEHITFKDVLQENRELKKKLKSIETIMSGRYW